MSAIRVERDPGFWREIAGHPAVLRRLGVSADQLVEFIGRPGVTPLASTHGGYVFSKLDGLGMVLEVHALFTPEGWGREVAASAHEAFRHIFAGPARVVVTYEQGGNFAPPLSHGWRPSGAFLETTVGSVRMWVLTVDAWAVSPAVRRSIKRCLS